MKSVMYSELQSWIELLEETVFFKLESIIVGRTISAEVLDGTNSDHHEWEESYQREIKKRDQEFKEYIKNEIKIIEILISSSNMYVRLQQWLVCLQRGMEYFLKETEDIDGGTRAGAQLQHDEMKLGMDYIQQGIRYIRIIIEPDICPRYEDQQAIEDIEVYLDKLIHIKRADLHISMSHKMSQETTGATINFVLHQDHGFEDWQGIDDIRGPTRSAIYPQVRQPRGYNSQQGEEHIRGPTRSAIYPELLQPHGYENQQGMEHIRGPTRSAIYSQVLQPHGYNSQLGVEPIRGPTRSANNPQVLQPHGYNSQQGMEHIRGPEPTSSNREVQPSLDS